MRKVLLGNRILDPDVLLKSDGIACGDIVILSLVKIEDRVIFNFKGECCSVCEKTCHYLIKHYSNGLILDVKSKIDTSSFVTELCSVLNILESRKGCVVTSVNLLLNGLRTMESKVDHVMPVVPLACDACIEPIKIQWHTKQPEKTKVSLRKVIKQVNSFDDKNYGPLQRLSKCVLSTDEKNQLKSLMKEVSKKEIKDSKKLRLPVLFYNHLQADQFENELLHLARKQIVSKHIALTEIKLVNAYIKDNDWSVAPVKGGKTSEFYPKGYERTHLDFDYVASNLDDGFKLIAYLINDRGFKFVSGGSVPFSMKVIQNIDKKEILNGHLHLEKILQDQYQVVIDINLGGFPLSRSSVIKVDHKKMISVEEQIVITLCHIFKHEKVYMKDLNDIYYMLNTKSIDYDYLLRLIRVNNLEFLMNIVLKTLKYEYDFVDNLLNIKTKAVNSTIERVVCKQWPYSIKSHFYAKTYDLLQRNIKLYGLSTGLNESHKQLTGHEEKVLEVTNYQHLSKSLNQRVYLSPLVLFNNTILLDACEMDVIEEGLMYRYSDLIITTFGIFLAIGDHHEFNKTQVESDLDYVIAILGLSNKDYNEDYIINARIDLWLY